MSKRQDIDHLFRSSEHTVHQELPPELWGRMERRLDQETSFKPLSSTWSWRSLSIAASVVMIMGVCTLLYFSIDRYEVEDLVATTAPAFSKEEIVSSMREQWHPSMLVINYE